MGDLITQVNWGPSMGSSEFGVVKRAQIGTEIARDNLDATLQALREHGIEALTVKKGEGENRREFVQIEKKDFGRLDQAYIARQAWKMDFAPVDDGPGSVQEIAHIVDVHDMDAEKRAALVKSLAGLGCNPDYIPAMARFGGQGPQHDHIIVRGQEPMKSLAAIVLRSWDWEYAMQGDSLAVRPKMERSAERCQALNGMLEQIGISSKNPDLRVIVRPENYDRLRDVLGDKFPEMKAARAPVEAFYEDFGVSPDRPDAGHAGVGKRAPRVV